MAELRLFAPNLVTVGIDGINDGDFYGRVWEPYNMEPEEFHGTNDLLIRMDNMYDRWDYPQKALRERSFIKESHTCDSMDIRKPNFKDKIDTIFEKRGEIATFSVQVKFRQRATWQGDVVWIEKNEMASFQSAWDLVKLFDQAIKDDVFDLEKETVR